LEQRPIDQELVLATTNQLDMQGYSFSSVTSAVAKYYRLRISDLTGPSRRKQIVLARGLAMYLARLLTAESLSKIGQYFGDRDHTTVLHSVRKVARLAQEHSSTRFAIKEIRDRLPNSLDDRKSPRSR
jgi:chromosomal replication initiator protein